ncbi:MAG TPA: hypothetical protein RMH99_19605 [Sandaracinaceae bacterium LLY-WYZ-13_1]|nr:hypothetical protein [Sandaracinaceae bacterium LLY-WYZ-13_1]
MRRWFIVGPFLLLVACGAGTSEVSRAGGGAETVAGRVTYEARHPTPQGASREVERRPGRHLAVALVGGAGAVVAEGRTDRDGRFALEGPADAAAVRVCARVRVRGHDVAVADDSLGRETHCFDTPVEDPGAELVVHVGDDEGHGGALHVVDTLLTGLDAVARWTDRTLPPLFTYWVRGQTREWSFYRGERPAGSGRYALELLGGQPGQQSVTDTDEHDEAIILHELGHFVMDRLSTDSSTGGMHPRGARIDPGLAWEEGRATWFALAVLGDPSYRDTIGVEPWGTLRVDENLESGEDPVAGIASETSVAKVLWDLSDGPGTDLPDEDEDGVALGPAAVLEAMVGLAEEDGSYGSLPAFLDYLVREGPLARDALAAMLTRTGEPVDELLPGDGVPWPPPVAIGDSVTGTIDGVTQPAPGGGRNLPLTGFSAIHTYRVRVEEPGMLVLRLYIQGSGRILDRTDLDLELLDRRADALARGASERPLETVGHLVQPGTYIVRVRDGGRGNRADYRLEVLQETLGGPPIPLVPP